VNTIGLKRKGFADERIERLKEIFRRLTSPKLNTSQALDRIAADFPGDADAEYVVAFVRSAKRGVHK
jgi:UDP-N-acetylglucosamine acyltransferase